MDASGAALVEHFRVVTQPIIHQCSTSTLNWGGQGADPSPLEMVVWVWSPPDPLKFAKFLKLCPKMQCMDG